MSEAGSEGQPQQVTDREQEIATEVLEVQRKRFYVDVKQNNRGRFMRLAEVELGGRKSRIILSMDVALEFRDHLDQFVKFFDGLASGEVQATPTHNGLLKSETITYRTRRYFLDLKENQRGKYLRVHQMLNRGAVGPRYQIAMPASGMAQLRDILTSLLEKYGEGYLNANNDNMESKQLRSENGKCFYFDVGHNDRGTYVRICEMTSYQASITVPLSSWGAFREILGELLEKEEAKSSVTKAAEKPAEAAVDPPAAAAAEEK